MAASVRDTSHGRVDVCLILDPDDPELWEYADSAGVRKIILPERVGYTSSLNAAVHRFWDHHSILGAFGDDVIFRTDDWDRQVEEALQTPGIAYGDDLIHGKNHPTAVWMSSSIAKALGWLALPATSHQWADDGWKRLGQKAGCLRFVPVIVEHMHPAVEKAEWDETYTSVFDGDRAKADYEGFQKWANGVGLIADARRVHNVLHPGER
jgi:hypothetical protein